MKINILSVIGIDPVNLVSLYPVALKENSLLDTPYQ